MRRIVHYFALGAWLAATGGIFCVGPIELSAAVVPSAPSAPATNSGLIPLVTNAPTNASLRDIRGPVEIPTSLTWLWRAAIAAALALLAWWAWATWRNRKGAPASDGLSPADRARRRLRESLALIHNPVAFVIEVSEAARVYLEQAFGLKAPERTTEEFLAELRQSIALDARHKELLADFLSGADLVKFARFEPGKAELEELHNAALRLVDETSMPRSGHPANAASRAAEEVPPFLTSSAALATEEPTGDDRYLPPVDYRSDRKDSEVSR